MTVELFVAIAVAAAIALAILLATTPRGATRVPPARPRRERDTVQALNAFGDDADRIFRQ